MENATIRLLPSRRLNRMIEDILKLSRKAQSHHEPLRLAPFLADMVAEFTESDAVAPSMRATRRHGAAHEPPPLRCRRVDARVILSRIVR